MPVASHAGAAVPEPRTIVADDGWPLAVRHWAGEQPRAIVIVVHDLRDHTGRHNRWAKHLADSGVDVVACDLRGHGETTHAVDHGMVEPRPVWRTLIADIGRVRRYALAELGVKPVFLVGLGDAGTDLVQSAVQAQGRQYAGAVLIGPGGVGRPRRTLMRWLSRLGYGCRGPTASATWLDRWPARVYQRRAGHKRGVARDASGSPTMWRMCAVEPAAAYAADPLCGGVLRLQTLAGVLAGAAEAGRRSRRLRVPPELPVLILAGRRDPVGQQGREPRRLARQLTNDGYRDVSHYCYDGAGHDLLFESAGDDVLADLSAWIDRRLTAAG
ncbi:hypothetical protein HKX41_06450 [Salinisphaera sp. USBA-960]|nr:hypothetical protein [Salifodinibacter halophilus]